MKVWIYQDYFLSTIDPDENESTIQSWLWNTFDTFD